MNCGGKKSSRNPSALPSPTAVQSPEQDFKNAIKNISPTLDKYDQKKYAKASDKLVNDTLHSIYNEKLNS